MSTELSELERVIRDALHADEIAAADLIHPTLRQPASRSVARLGAAITAAAVVVGVAVLAALLVVDRGGSDHSAAGSDALAGIVGYRWQVTHIVDDQGALDVPTSLKPQVGFTHDGYILADDTLNALQANYTPTADGYEADSAGSSLVGSTGMDHITGRVVQAFDSVFQVIVSGLDDTPPPLFVTASLTDGTLTLQRDGVELTLARVGVQPDFFAQPPSMTPTATSSR